MDERELDEAIIDNVEDGIFRVHRKVFVDPHVFELERERVFGKTWQYVAHESEVQKSGDFCTRTIAGRDVIVVRDDEGQVHVFYNRCSHRGALVTVEESGCAEFFRCPYHSWTYNKKGRLTGVPGAESYGPNWKKEDMSLTPVPKVENYRGFIFASIDPNIESLVASFKDALDYIDLICDQTEDGFEVVPGRNKYSTRANWKVLVESYSDNYHVVMLHSRYLQHYRDLGIAVAPMGERSAISHGIGLGNGHCVAQHQQFAALGRLAGGWGPNLPDWSKEEIDNRRAALEKRLGAERADRITKTTRNMRIFPLLHVIDQISPTIRVVTPRAVDRCDVEEWVLAPKGESAEMRALRTKNVIIQHGGGSFLGPDDVEMLEREQRGLENAGVDWCDNSRGFKIGRALSSDEQQMRALYRRWHELITLGRVSHPVSL